MFIQVNENLSLSADDIIMILDKECYKECYNQEFKNLSNIEIIDSKNINEDDIKSYIIARDANSKDKGKIYRIYKSTKSSLSLLNKYDKLEVLNG